MKGAPGSSIQDIFRIQKESSVLLRTEPIRYRLARLKKLENWILGNREEIRKAVYADFQKTAYEVDLSEIYATLVEVRDARKHLKYWVRPKRVGVSLNYWGTRSHIQYEPRGTSLIIAPWNYPFMLTIGPLVSAIAAGCTALLKPSEFTPATSRLISQMISDLFDEKIAAVIQGDYKVAGELLKLPFDHIYFTGSPQVGKVVMEAAAKNLSSITLELGGKSPVIIDHTADLNDAAQKIAWGKWLNAGQSCVAPDYLLVHSNNTDQFIRYLKRHIDKLYTQKEQTSVINDRHFIRLTDLLKNALSEGAKVEYNQPTAAETRRFGLTVLSGVTMEMKLMKEEIFGPILPIITYTNLDEALALINKNEKPLSLYLFSRDKKNMNRVKKETSAGGMCVNECVLQFAHPQLPFGGVNNSGLGNSHGYYGFKAFTHEKSVLKQRRGFTMAKTLYPPLDKIKKITLDFLIKHM